MNDPKQQLIEDVKAYLKRHDEASIKTTTLIRGVIELQTEQIRVLLAALCQYKSDDEYKMELRYELIEKFFVRRKS